MSIVPRFSLLVLLTLAPGLHAVTLDMLDPEQMDLYQWYRSLPVQVEVMHPEYAQGELTIVPKAWIKGACSRFLSEVDSVATGQYAHLDEVFWRDLIASAWTACRNENIRRYVSDAEAARKKSFLEERARVEAADNESVSLSVQASQLQAELLSHGIDENQKQGTGCELLDPDAVSRVSGAALKESELEKQRNAVSDCSSSMSRLKEHSDRKRAERDAGLELVNSSRAILASVLDMKARIEALPQSQQKGLMETVCGDLSLSSSFMNEAVLAKKKEILLRMESALNRCPDLISDAEVLAEKEAKENALIKKARDANFFIKKSVSEAERVDNASGGKEFLLSVKTVIEDSCVEVNRFSVDEAAGLIFLSEGAIRKCLDAISKEREKMEPRLNEIREAEEKRMKEIAARKAEEKQNSRSSMSFGRDNIDDLTTYAVLLGRGLGCGIDMDREAALVGAWIDRTWSGSERGAYTMTFALGVEQHMKLQRSGRSPDDCAAVTRVLREVSWP